jgi:hypothetical protein
MFNNYHSHGRPFGHTASNRNANHAQDCDSENAEKVTQVPLSILDYQAHDSRLRLADHVRDKYTQHP